MLRISFRGQKYQTGDCPVLRLETDKDKIYPLSLQIKNDIIIPGGGNIVSGIS